MPVLPLDATRPVRRDEAHAPRPTGARPQSTSPGPLLSKRASDRASPSSAQALRPESNRTVACIRNGVRSGPGLVQWRRAGHHPLDWALPLPVSSRGAARATPSSEQKEAVFPSFSGPLRVFLRKGGKGVPSCARPPACFGVPKAVAAPPTPPQGLPSVEEEDRRPKRVPPLPPRRHPVPPPQILRLPNIASDQRRVADPPPRRPNPPTAPGSFTHPGFPTKVISAFLPPPPRRTRTGGGSYGDTFVATISFLNSVPNFPHELFGAVWGPSCSAMY